MYKLKCPSLMSFIATSLLLLIPISSNASEASAANILCLPESSIVLDGDSSVRKFSATATSFHFNGSAKMNQHVIDQLLWAPAKMLMILPVESLKTGERTLDKHMHESLKSEKYPSIEMKLENFNFSDGHVTSSGTLTVAGVSKAIELQSSLSVENQKVRIIGKKIILMSDFGIDPPTMMLGTLKTKDEININYNVVCSLENQQKAKNENK